MRIQFTQPFGNVNRRTGRCRGLIFVRLPVLVEVQFGILPADALKWNIGGSFVAPERDLFAFEVEIADNYVVALVFEQATVFVASALNEARNFAHTAINMHRCRDVINSKPGSR